MIRPVAPGSLTGGFPGVSVRRWLKSALLPKRRGTSSTLQAVENKKTPNTQTDDSLSLTGQGDLERNVYGTLPINRAVPRVPDVHSLHLHG